MLTEQRQAQLEQEAMRVLHLTTIFSDLVEIDKQQIEGVYQTTQGYGESTKYYLKLHNSKIRCYVTKESYEVAKKYIEQEQKRIMSN